MESMFFLLLSDCSQILYLFYSVYITCSLNLNPHFDYFFTHLSISILSSLHFHILPLDINSVTRIHRYTHTFGCCLSAVWAFFNSLLTNQWPSRQLTRQRGAVCKSVCVFVFASVHVHLPTQKVFLCGSGGLNAPKKVVKTDIIYIVRTSKIT